MTEVNPQFGWAGEAAAAREWELLAARFAPFEIKGQTVSTAGKSALLWTEAMKACPPAGPKIFNQEIGDCVSHGAASAVNYLACIEIVRLGQNEAYRPAFPPYIYGTSRVQVGGGRLGTGDGSLGSWAADAVKRYGVLPSDAEGVPAYSGGCAKEWGVKGPPQKYLDLAKPHCLETTALVRSYEQVRDALCNGYPVTVASDQGFEGTPLGPGFGRLDRGKRWGVPAGQWMHQMCFIGVDDDSQGRPGCYCLNSWGEGAHGDPAGGEPRGGFWVDADTVNRMVRQGDSFAFSQFIGFPQQLNWFVF